MTALVQTLNNYDVTPRTIANYANISLVCVQPLADAEGAKRQSMIDLLKEHGGLTYVCGRKLDLTGCLGYCIAKF